VSLELERPEHLDTKAWEAVEYYRRHFADAAAASDRPAVVGAAKELIECIARCVLDATENPLEDSANFPKLVRSAQKALQRVAGKDITTSDDVRLIAGSAQNIATAVGALRNDVGTGHGRARVADIDAEMVGIVIDATMLWCRWALRRLGHLLAFYPTHLIAAVASATNQERLQRYFNDVRLPEQPRDIQRAIGVAFGRESAGGFGNATAVGVSPAAASPDLDAFPVDYRLGLVEGMVITYGGQIGLIDSYVPWLLDVLAPVPSAEAVPALTELAETARTATWITRWRSSPFDPAATVATLRSDLGRLESKVQPALQTLAAALDPALRG
jgi:hypothetical protein